MDFLDLLFYLFCFLAIFGRLFFLVKIFPKIIFFNANILKNQNANIIPVSIIICAKNEAKNLEKNLPKILNQIYADFEVIVVNDRSNDNSLEILEKLKAQYSNLRILNISQKEENIDGKKNALFQGINFAKNDLLLLTDADCVPASSYWIIGMKNTFFSKKGIKITLGISPYLLEKKSFLNDFIQYETLYTMLQYTGLAYANMAYMGVGRNIMYQKSFFLEKKGLEKYKNIMGGDDDLWVNEAFENGNVNVCFVANSYTYSTPKNTWQEWFWQKRRHLSVATHYRPSIKIILGLLHISQLLFWVIFFLGIFFRIKILGIDIMLIWAIFGAMWWGAMIKINQIYKMQTKNWLIPFFDFIFTFYIFVVGILARIFTPHKWKI